MAVIKVKSTHIESQGPYVLIEESTFNPDIHQLYIENEVIEEVKEKPIKEPKTPKMAKEQNIDNLGDK